MSAASRRYYRTIILGVVAMGGLIWAAIDQFDIAPQEMAELFLSVAIGGLAIIFVAALCVAIWSLLRRLLNRRRD